MKQLVLGIVFFNTLLMPLVAAIAMKRFGHIKSLKMERREERVMPFFLTVLLYGSCYYSLLQVNMPKLIAYMILGATISVFVGAVISLFWKISIHLIGIGGFVAMLFVLFNQSLLEFRYYLMASMILAGIVGSARLIAGTHSEQQIYSGFLVGFICLLIPFLI
ncbi:MAG: hypothetical protein COC01_03890 [Bacteroidetes bacterium]|nr:MAG: hypothetical protein COC01_03890 [Bacteroidota bacterium]